MKQTQIMQSNDSTKKGISLTSHHYIYAHEDNVRNFGQILTPALESWSKRKSNPEFWIIARAKSFGSFTGYRIYLHLQA